MDSEGINIRIFLNKLNGYLRGKPNSNIFTFVYVCVVISHICDNIFYRW